MLNNNILKFQFPWQIYYKHFISVYLSIFSHMSVLLLSAIGPKCQSHNWPCFLISGFLSCLILNRSSLTDIEATPLPTQACKSFHGYLKLTLCRDTSIMKNQNFLGFDNRLKEIRAHYKYWVIRSNKFLICILFI